MKKLEKDLYIKHAKRLQAILDDKSTFVRFLNRKDFSLVIKNELNVLGACEKLFPKVDLDAKCSSKALSKAFNKWTKGTFKVDENYKYEDETDLIDAINYLPTFCNNMFRVNIDDVVSGKQVTATDPHIDLKAKPEFDGEGPKINPNFAFAGAMGMGATPYENPYLVGKAYAKINDDMREGRFYRFKTKPRIIPIAKWVAVILSMLLILGLLAAGIMAFIANGIEIEASGKTGPLNLISNGIIYLISAAFGVYPLYITMKNLVGKGAKNHNLKYYFNWGFIVMFLVLALLFGLMDGIPMWMNSFNPTSAATETFRYPAFMGMKVVLMIVVALVGLCIAPIVIGAVKNPKPDTEAVERKMREYIDLFMSDSGQMPVPPKADVQKPKEVKESKKDSKSKKPDKK